MAIEQRIAVERGTDVDEAHQFLSGPDTASLIDAELGGYVWVTYRVSQLDPAFALVEGSGERLTPLPPAGEWGAVLIPDPRGARVELEFREPRGEPALHPTGGAAARRSING